MSCSNANVLFYPWICRALLLLLRPAGPRTAEYLPPR